MFAIEHPVAPDVVAALGPSLDADLRRNGGLEDAHWLCWVVFATEKGYNFAGLEYWGTFAESIPSWYRLGDSNRLRSWFGRFSKQFGGISPSGPWASKCTYIAWPITNALLPKDLQSHLVQSIFHAKNDLNGISQMDLGAIGAIMRRHNYAGSKRYANFLENEELIGRIVLALLESKNVTNAKVSATAIERIVKDLEQKSHAREWLADGRQWFAKQSIRLRVPLAGSSTEGNDVQSDTARLFAFDPRPSISLRRSDKDHWRAILHLPSFATYAASKPDLTARLQSLRYTVPICGDASNLGSGLLSRRAPPKTLKRWPNPHEEILATKTADIEVKDAVSKVRWHGSEKTVFKVHIDGTAAMLRTNILSPGQRYIVVSSTAASIDNLGGQVRVDCPNTHAVEIVLDDPIAASKIKALEDAGFSVRRTVTITPAGLWPRLWDGEGNAEYLLGELICFEVARDHEFDALEVSLNRQPGTIIKVPESGSILLTLQSATVGVTTMTIGTKVRSGHGYACAAESVRQIQVEVRSPSYRESQAHSLQALTVSVTPLAPTLDDLIEQRLEVQVHGNAFRTAKCSLAIVDGAGVPASTQELLTRALPITAEHWRSALGVVARKISVSDLYSAPGAYIEIDAEDLGYQRIHLLNELPPLRWDIKGAGHQSRAHIVNEGVIGEMRVSMFSYEQPTHPIPMEIDKFAGGLLLENLDGLCVAEVGDQTSAMLCSPLITSLGLKGLRPNSVMPAFHILEDTRWWSESLHRWRHCRPVNAQASHKRDGVLQNFKRVLWCALYGASWVQREEALKASLTEIEWNKIESAVEPRAKNPSYAISLYRGWNPDGNHDSLKAAFAKTSFAYAIAESDALVDFAWEMARHPLDFAESEGPTITRESVEKLMTLARGARLVSLFQELSRAKPS